LPARYFLVVTPRVHVPTAAIFSEKSLTRDSKPLTITDFLAQHSCSAEWPDSFGRNDMQQVVVGKYAEVAQVLGWFDNIAPARMTGSGASVFAAFRNRDEAEAAQAKLPSEWNSKPGYTSTLRFRVIGFASSSGPTRSVKLKVSVGESPSWLRHRILIPAFEGSSPSSPAKNSRSSSPPSQKQVHDEQP
jgi:hypothetical protein